MVNSLHSRLEGDERGSEADGGWKVKWGRGGATVTAVCNTLNADSALHVLLYDPPSPAEEIQV